MGTRLIFVRLTFLLFFLYNNICNLWASAESTAITFEVKQEFIDDVKKPLDDQKNGMLVFYQSEDEPGHIQKLASGVFPTMTKYFDISFIELVDILLPETSTQLKRLYLLYMKLADLISKIRGKQDTKHAMSTTQFCLNNIPESIDLGEEKDKWLEIYRSNKPIGNQLNNALFYKVEKQLSNLIPQYVDALDQYYNKTIYTAPPQHHTLILDALEQLKTIDITPTSFKRFMNQDDAIWLRNYAHTEDMMIYQLYQGAPPIKPYIFSLNDLCYICRQKFTHPATKALLPNILVYCSIFQLQQREKSQKREYKKTTVDYVFDGNKFSPELNHRPIDGICQIRMPQYVPILQKFTVEFRTQTWHIEKISEVSEQIPQTEWEDGILLPPEEQNDETKESESTKSEEEKQKIPITASASE